MRYLGVLIGAILLAAMQAGAQGNVPGSLLLDPSSGAPSPTLNVPAAAAIAAAPADFETRAPEFSGLYPMAPATSQSAAPQEIKGVFGDYSTQVFAGFTYFPFYKVPGTVENMPGADISMAYYLKYLVAADVEAFGAIGSNNGQATHFVFFGGGPRVRYVTSRGPEIWAHALVGFAHSGPESVYVNPTGFAFEAGGGVDFGQPHRRWVYRLQGDLIGTRLFGTYQYSPKVAAGIVFKF